MRVPIGYVIAPEEERGTCRGCAFLIISNSKCSHPDSGKTFNDIGCGKERKIFKRDGRNFRAKLTGLINKLGFDNANGIPDYVLADHMINSMESLCEASRVIKKHCSECNIVRTAS